MWERVGDDSFHLPRYSHCPSFPNLICEPCMGREVPCSLVFSWGQPMGETGRISDGQRRERSGYFYCWLLSRMDYSCLSLWTEGLVRQCFPEFCVTSGSDTHYIHLPSRSTGRKSVEGSRLCTLYPAHTYVTSCWWCILYCYPHLLTGNWHSARWDVFFKATEEANVRSRN